MDNLEQNSGLPVIEGDEGETIHFDTHAIESRVHELGGKLNVLFIGGEAQQREIYGLKAQALGQEQNLVVPFEQGGDEIKARGREVPIVVIDTTAVDQEPLIHGADLAKEYLRMRQDPSERGLAKDRRLVLVVNGKNEVTAAANMIAQVDKSLGKVASSNERSLWQSPDGMTGVIVTDAFASIGALDEVLPDTVKINPVQD